MKYNQKAKLTVSKQKGGKQQSNQPKFPQQCQFSYVILLFCNVAKYGNKGFMNNHDITTIMKKKILKHMVYRH